MKKTNNGEDSTEDYDDTMTSKSYEATWCEDSLETRSNMKLKVN